MVLVYVRPTTLVLSDMAPKFSGVPSVDKDRQLWLAEDALDFATISLVEGGCFVTKAGLMRCNLIS